MKDLLGSPQSLSTQELTRKSLGMERLAIKELLFSKNRIKN